MSVLGSKGFSFDILRLLVSSLYGVNAVFWLRKNCNLQVGLSADTKTANLLRLNILETLSDDLKARGAISLAVNPLGRARWPAIGRKADPPVFLFQYGGLPKRLPVSLLPPSSPPTLPAAFSPFILTTILAGLLISAPGSRNCALDAGWASMERFFGPGKDKAGKPVRLLE